MGRRILSLSISFLDLFIMRIVRAARAAAFNIKFGEHLTDVYLVRSFERILAFSAKFPGSQSPKFANFRAGKKGGREGERERGMVVHTLPLKRTKLLGSCTAPATAAQSISIRVFFEQLVNAGRPLETFFRPSFPGARPRACTRIHTSQISFNIRGKCRKRRGRQLT